MTLKVDRRVQKTRQILQQAIVELVVEKGFESIKVQDILDKANIGRTTFYAHYQDKGELLHACFEEVHAIFEQYLVGLSESSGNLRVTKINSEFTGRLFRFAERNAQLFKALLKHQDLSVFINYSFVVHLNQPVKNWLVREKNCSIPSEIVIHYFISAFFGVLKWWVNHDMPCTAEEIDGYFKQLAIPTLKSI